MTKYPNREALRKAHDIYRDAMRRFIMRCLKRIQGITVEELIRDSLDDRGIEQFEQDLQRSNGSIEAVIDIKHFPNIIRKYWSGPRGFRQDFDFNSKVRGKTETIVEGRNFWAHPGVEDVDPAHTQANLTSVAEVLGEIKNQDAKREVEDIRDQLFSHEVEKHPAEVECANLKERLANRDDELKAEKAKLAQLDEQLQDAENKLAEMEGMEAEWVEMDERLKTALKELMDTRTEKSESDERIKTLSEQLTKLENRPKNELSPIAERFRARTTLEERETIGRKVAALRIDAEGSKGVAWREIREELRRREGLHLKQEDLREVIRREDHFKESVVERIESFEGGWECQSDLTVLCGFEPTGAWIDRIEACKPNPLEVEDEIEYEESIDEISDGEMTKIFRARLRGWSWEEIASWSGQPLGIEKLETLRTNTYYKDRAKRYAAHKGVKIELLV